MKWLLIILVFASSCTTTEKTAVIRLDGSKSYDPDGYISKWSWRQLSGPAVIIRNRLSDTTTANASDKEVSYSFELTVTDNQGAVDKDTVTIGYKKKSPKLF
jgi:hypothetical protein